MSFSPNEAIMWLHIPSAGLPILPSEGKTWLLRANVWNPASFTCSLSLSKSHNFSGPGCNLLCANAQINENSKYGSIPLYRHYSGAMSSVYEQYVFPAPCWEYNIHPVHVNNCCVSTRFKDLQRHDVCQQPSSRKYWKNSQRLSCEILQASFLQKPSIT